MEHNIKIKDFKRFKTSASPFVKYQNILGNTHSFTNSEEQQKLTERFTDLHWQTDNVLLLNDHNDKMFVLRQQNEQIREKQNTEREDVQHHRLQHLQSIKDNIKESRDRFARRTALERPGGIELQQGDKPLYKIVNDGIPITY